MTKDMTKEKTPLAKVEGVRIRLLGEDLVLPNEPMRMMIDKESGEFVCGFLRSKTIIGRILKLSKVQTKIRTPNNPEGLATAMFMQGKSVIYWLIMGEISTKRLHQYFYALQEAVGLSPLDVKTEISSELVDLPRFSKSTWVLMPRPLLDAEGAPEKLPLLLPADCDRLEATIDNLINRDYSEDSPTE